MKKFLLLALALGSLVLATTALAEPAIPVQVKPPTGFGIDPSQVSVDRVFTNALRLVFIIATLAVLVYMIWGAFQWITSGGDKDAVGNARKRITHALIGLAILALAFLIVFVVGQIVGINVIGQQVNIPTLSEPVGAPPVQPLQR